MKEYQKFLLILAVFLAAYFIPFHYSRVQDAIIESILLLQDYAQKHVLFCLVPAFFIAGGIAVFISQTAVLKYFGAQAGKFLSYSVASVSGSILAVCSCTVLPLFAGIYSRGAGIGPATAFLYSGPAINVLAIILTARILGPELGVARAVGAISFALIIGLVMSLLFERKQEHTPELLMPEDDNHMRPLWKNAVYFCIMVLVLIFAAWGKPSQPVGFWNFIFEIHWYIAAVLLIALIAILKFWFHKEELREWVGQTWGFAKLILPLLFGGVIVAGLLMGRPGTDNGLIPNRWVATLVGGNGFLANLIASVAGAFMYFATLTEVPILQGLIGSGMGKGPALALLLAGPALSLPNMLVIHSVMGIKRTAVFVLLVIIMATGCGMLFGALYG